MECPYCKEDIKEGALKCKHCGTMLYSPEGQEEASAPTKSKRVAGYLALFLGGLGIHKFYLGNWGWGIIYVLFVWTYIPVIIAFIELIRYCILSDEEFQKKVAEKNGPFSFLW